MAKLQYRYQGSLSCPNIAVRMTQPDNCFDLQLLWAKLYIKDTNNKYPGSTWTVLLCIDGQWRYYSHHQWRYHSHHWWRYHTSVALSLRVSEALWHIISGVITSPVALSLRVSEALWHIISGVITQGMRRYDTSSVAFSLTSSVTLSLRVSEALWHIISGVITHHQWRYHSHHQWRYHITSGDITQGIRGVITHHQWRYHSVIKGVTTHHQWCYHTSSVALSLRVSEALWHIISGVITRIISGVIIHHQCRYSKPWPSPFCLNFHMNKRQF